MSAAGAMQHQTGNAPRGAGIMRQQPAVEQQRNPAAHARSDDDAPARRMVSEHVEGLVQPGRDRAIGEFAARFTMTRIVEAQRRPARIASQARKASALLPVMSDMKPPSQKKPQRAISSPLPSSR